MDDHAPIETERMLLAPISLTHVDAVYAMMREPDAMRFWSEAPHQSRDVTAQMIARLIAGPERGWALTLKDSGEAIGLVYYLGNVGPPGMGYILHPREWGRGLMTEAVRGALRYGFERLGLNRVELWIDSRNRPSQRVAERAGFSRRSAFRQKYPRDQESHEKLGYGLRVDEWRADGATPPPAMGQAYGIAPVLPVRDVRAAVEFYRDKLGFEILFLHGDPPTYGVATLNDWTAGGATIHFSAASEIGAASLYVNVGPDMARLEESCRARGVEIVKPLALMPWGQREFSIRDCDGHALCFSAPG